MTQLTNLGPAASYGDLLTTTNNGQGLTNVLQNLQDGLGNNSTVQIATNAINFNRSGGRTFQLDGVPLTVSATNLNSLSQTKVVGEILSEEVKTMHGSCIQVIPAVPDAYIMINQFIVYLFNNGVNYQQGGAVYLQYSAQGVPAGDNQASEEIPVELIRSGVSVIGEADGVINNSATAESFLPGATLLNSPVCITNANNAFTVGDGDIRYYISYSVVTFIN